MADLLLTREDWIVVRDTILRLHKNFDEASGANDPTEDVTLSVGKVTVGAHCTTIRPGGWLTDWHTQLDLDQWPDFARFYVELYDPGVFIFVDGVEVVYWDTTDESDEHQGYQIAECLKTLYEEGVEALLTKINGPTNIAAASEDICPECGGKGWEIFNEFDGGPEIQACDCGLLTSDEEAENLPEAHIALAQALTRRGWVHLDNGEGGPLCGYDCAPGKVSGLPIDVTCPTCTQALEK